MLRPRIQKTDRYYSGIVSEGLLCGHMNDDRAKEPPAFGQEVLLRKFSLHTGNPAGHYSATVTEVMWGLTPRYQ